MVDIWKHPLIFHVFKYFHYKILEKIIILSTDAFPPKQKIGYEEIALNNSLHLNKVTEPIASHFIF